MKIDLSSAAITFRLKQVEQLRQACLALAGSSFALQIRQNIQTPNQFNGLASDWPLIGIIVATDMALSQIELRR